MMDTFKSDRGLARIIRLSNVLMQMSSPRQKHCQAVVVWLIDKLTTVGQWWQYLDKTSLRVAVVHMHYQSTRRSCSAHPRLDQISPHQSQSCRTQPLEYLDW